MMKPSGWTMKTLLDAEPYKAASRRRKVFMWLGWAWMLWADRIGFFWVKRGYDIYWLGAAHERRVMEAAEYLHEMLSKGLLSLKPVSGADGAFSDDPDKKYLQ